MKKLIYIFAAAALLGGLAACGQKVQEETIQSVDLRYRADSEYNLSATGAKAFVIVVTSTSPWTITSEHPDWCIISEESGEASPRDSVKIGHGNKTNVRVQYYDNPDLDDRTDKITIASDYWVGKVITVRQKGIAYLTVPDEDLDLEVGKAGGDMVFHVNANQDWSAEVTSGNWITIADGSKGKGNGTVTISAIENAGEERYAEVTVFDRHNVPMAKVLFTQDGVKLIPAITEVRANYDTESAEIGVSSNANWEATKVGDVDWFTIDTPSGTNDGTIKISFVKNEGDAIRKASILLKSISANPDDAVVEKEIVIKQGYKVTPVRVMANDDLIASWESDWANVPTYTKDVGVLFNAKARLHNGSMPFGEYTFRWSALTPDPANGGPRVRHWFCFGESAELKFDVRPSDGKCSFDVNAAGDGNKPSLDSFTDLDFTQPVEITYRFERNGVTGTFGDQEVEYCHITYLVNGTVANTFDTGPTLLRSIYFGSNINMYIGCDTAGSAVLEWYEYTAPLEWDD